MNHKKHTPNRRHRKPAKMRKRQIPKDVFQGQSFRPMIAPNHFDTILTYQATGVLSSNVSDAYKHAWQVNDLYDQDATFGTAYPLGFIELANLYKYYRVIKYRIKIRVANKEDFPVVITTLPSNLTITAGAGSLESMAGNALFRMYQLSAKGGGKDQLTISFPWIDISRFVGDTTPYVEANYAATTSGEPANKVYHAISASTGTGAGTLTNGVLYTVTLETGTRFTERVNINLSSADPPQPPPPPPPAASPSAPAPRIALAGAPHRHF